MTAARSNGKAPRVEPIAIIGMRGRFPGAADLDRFWQNLAEGVESITPLTPEDMRSAGVPDTITSLPGYVNAAPLLGDVDQFDAGFFGFSARDASLTDPQHRIFLETAWEALEDAGYDPGTFPGNIGVFGGCELSTYLYQLSQNLELLGYVDGMQLMVTNDKDHLCTQVSYRLNLRGPSIAVQTTCSTSLVAITLACESLQGGRCDIALAGGVTIRVPQRGGYLYVAGSILSPDGHCRPFDANAQGTIVGSGVGIIVLKRLRDALVDDDTIRAVILGFGLNNDGSDKVGYTAPGFRGQLGAVAAAYEMAGVSPASIGFVEAHGTGTILGDPIELAALTEVFRAHTDRRGYCGIGSVKSNFGHLSCASGVAGLIKAVLALDHGAIPATVHFQAPNPALDLAGSPFFVTTALHPWERNGAPRRAAVSSFGVGGTNAHVVVEEAPDRPAPQQRRPHQLFVVSARSQAALDESTRRLAGHLTRHPERDLADAAFTLHVGRRAFRHRRSLVVASGDRAGTVTALLDPERLGGHESGAAAPPVVFMFPGQGSQYPGMISGLYDSEPLVRRTIDRCCRVLQPELGLDLRRILFPGARRQKTAAAELRDTALAQPALFVVGYALARLWQSWGVTPAAMIGHSIGEYVAATLADVMTLDDALRLLARRGRLISALPAGSMLAVMAPAKALDEFIDREVCLAAVNAPELCVLSGPSPAVERVERALAARSIAARRLHTSHAFHSSMMEPILSEFEDLVAEVALSAPTIPYIATLTGQWADGGPTRPAYWSAQIRSTVRFAEGLETLTANATADPVLLEVGPGRALVTFATSARSNGQASTAALASLPGPSEGRADTEVALTTLGHLWERGVTVDWDAYHRNERRRRVSLPTYPFERQSYWVGRPNRPDTEPPPEPRDPGDWFALPVWREKGDHGAAPVDLDGTPVLVFDEETGVGAAVADALRVVGARPLLVRRGEHFQRTDHDEFVLDPAEPAGFAQLTAAVCTTERRLGGVIHCWGAADPGATDLDDGALFTFMSPLRLAVALGSHTTVRPLPMLLVARGTSHVTAEDRLDPPRSFGIGAAKVLPQEHPGLRVAHVDVDDDPRVAAMVLAELATGAAESEVAIRRGRRYARAYEPLTIADAVPPNGLPARPTIVVTGGLGHMGLILAEAAFTQLGAQLVLIGRSVLPPPDQWGRLSENPAAGEDQRVLLRRLAVMRAERDDVLVVAADLNDASQVQRAIDAAIARFGTVDLVVHGAANVSPAAFGPAADTGPSLLEAQMSPKIRGLLHLIDAFQGREPKRWLIHGSISSVLGGLGLAAYAGANAVLDTIAQRGALAGGDWLSVGWDAWDNAGEAKMMAIPTAIRPPEGQEAFLRLLGTALPPCVVVAVHDLEARLEAWVRLVKVPRSSESSGHPRPNMSTAFVEPRDETERILTDIWASQLGIDAVGVHDRFFDLGGHSLLAVQVASEIRDRFQIEMPVLQIFKAPTISELARLVEQAQQSEPPVAAPEPVGAGKGAPDPPTIHGDGPGVVAKASYRAFYDDVTRRLEATGMGEASFFLNYGYRSLGTGDEAVHAVPEGVFNPSSIRLAYELIGATDLDSRQVVDVGCGRGGTALLLADKYGAQVVGVDLSPEAVAFCRRTHRHPSVRFEVGDAEHLPLEAASCDVVTNLESSHTYPDMRAFLSEVRRVLRRGGAFLHTDLLAGPRWLEVRAILAGLGFMIDHDREITANVLASCDEVAAGRTKAFGEPSAMIDNFLAVPGSAVYEQMRTGAWEYRIMRCRLK